MNRVANNQSGQDINSPFREAPNSPSKKKNRQSKADNSQLSKKTENESDSEFMQQSGCCHSFFYKHFQPYKRWYKQVQGRNGVVMSIMLINLVFKIGWGFWDEISDWIYYFQNSSAEAKEQKSGFQTIALQELMLFFLIAQYGLQLLAWSLIFGQLTLNDYKKIFKKDRLYDPDDETKNVTNLLFWIILFLYYTTMNFFIILWYSITKLHYALLFTFLNEIKATPFVVHYYFQANFNVVLTKEVMRTMASEIQRQKIKERQNILHEKKKKEQMKLNQMFSIKQEDIDMQAQTEIDKIDKRQQKSDPQYFNKQLKKYQHVALDANLEANLTTFLFEGILNSNFKIIKADLEKYLRMTDTIEAIFEAMPMAILQFLNNQIKVINGIDAWSFFDILSFVSSAFTISLYCIQLIQNMFQEDADILWDQIREFGQQKDLSKVQNPLAVKYQYPQTLNIMTKVELLKFQQSTLLGALKVKNLNIYLPDKMSNETMSIIESLGIVADKTQLKNFTLRMNDCNINFQQLYYLFNGLKKFHKIDSDQCVSSVVLDLKKNRSILNPFTTDVFTDSQKWKQMSENDQLDILIEAKDEITRLTNSLKRIFENLKTKDLKLILWKCNIEFSYLLIFMMGISKAKYIEDLTLDLRNNLIKNEDCESENQQKLNRINELFPDFENVQSFTINLSENMLQETGFSQLINIIFINFNSTRRMELDFSNNQIGKSPKQINIGKSDQESSQLIQKLKYLKLNLNGADKIDSPTRQLSIEEEIDENNNANQDFTQIPIKKQGTEIIKQCLIDEHIYRLTEQFLNKLKKLTYFELNLSFNRINQSILQLFDQACGNWKNLKKCVLDLKENQIDIETIQKIAEFIPDKLMNVSFLSLDLRNNQKLNNTIYFNQKIIFENEDYSHESQGYQNRNLQKDFLKKVQKQILEMCLFDNNYLRMTVVEIPDIDSTNVKSTFTIGDDFFINFKAQKIIISRYQPSRKGVEIDQIKELYENNFTIGKKETKEKYTHLKQDISKELEFIEDDNSVSHNHCIIEQKTIKGKEQEGEQFVIRNKDTNTKSPTQFLIKNSKYQLYKKCIISLGIGRGQIKLIISNISNNQTIPYDSEFSKNTYSWHFIDQQNEEQKQQVQQQIEEENDPDATPRSDYAALEFVEQDDVLEEGGIQIEIMKGPQKNQLGDDRKQSKQTFSIYNSLLYIGQQPTSEADIEPHAEVFKIIPGVGDESQVSDLHCIIGHEVVGGKSWYYIQVPKRDDDHFLRLNPHPRTTLLQLSDTKDTDYDFELKSGIHLSIGFTVFNIQVVKQSVDSKQVILEDKSYQNQSILDSPDGLNRRIRNKITLKALNMKGNNSLVQQSIKEEIAQEKEVIQNMQDDKTLQD